MSERRTVDGLTLSSIALQFSGMREERSVVHFVEERCMQRRGDRREERFFREASR